MRSEQTLIAELASNMIKSSPFTLQELAAIIDRTDGSREIKWRLVHDILDSGLFVRIIDRYYLS